MARYTCPSCGAPYNGRKCRSCLYENFGEGKLREARAEKKPLTAEIPVSGRTGEKAPASKKTRGKNPMARFFVLLMVIYSLMPMVRNWGLDLKARERESTVRQVAVRAEPEPIMAPEEKVILHQEQGVTVFANEKDLEDFRDGLCVYVQYSGALAHVTMSAGDIRVNGCDMKLSSLVCKAQRGGNIGKGWLELDAKDLEENGITEPETLRFTMTALGSNGRALFTTDEIVIEPEGAA